MPITNTNPVSASEVIAFTRFQSSINFITPSYENKPYKLLPRPETPPGYPSFTYVNSLLQWKNKPKRSYGWDGAGSTWLLAYEKTFNSTLIPADSFSSAYYNIQTGQFIENYNSSTVFNAPWNALSVRLGVRVDATVPAPGRMTAYFTNMPVGTYKIASYFRVGGYALDVRILRTTPGSEYYLNETIYYSNVERLTTFTLSSESTVAFDVLGSVASGADSQAWELTILRSA